MVSTDCYLTKFILGKGSLVTVLPTKTTKVIKDIHSRSNSSGHVYCQFQILLQVMNVWSPHLKFDHFIVNNILGLYFDLNFDYFKSKLHFIQIILSCCLRVRSTMNGFEQSTQLKILSFTFKCFLNENNTSVNAQGSILLML